MCHIFEVVAELSNVRKEVSSSATSIPNAHQVYVNFEKLTSLTNLCIARLDPDPRDVFSGCDRKVAENIKGVGINN